MAYPIEGRCRHCGGTLYLSEIIEQNTGECPRCGEPLSRDWTFLLLEEARNAEGAQVQLIKSLRRLVGLPGNLDLTPYSVVRNIFEEVGWEQDIIAEPDLIREEVRQLREQAEMWETLLPKDKEAEAPAVADAFRRLAQRLRRHARAMDARGADSAAAQSESARSAAHQLEAVADTIAAESRSPDEMHKSLDAAEGAQPAARR